jgi:hypothetical protein
MFRKKVIIIASFVMATTLLRASCALINQSTSSNGIGWGSGVFGSNGERIYFTATSDRGTDISYSGGPSSNGWMIRKNILPDSFPICVGIFLG